MILYGHKLGERGQAMSRVITHFTGSGWVSESISGVVVGCCVDDFEDISSIVGIDGGEIVCGINPDTGERLFKELKIETFGELAHKVIRDVDGVYYYLDRVEDKKVGAHIHRVSYFREMPLLWKGQDRLTAVENSGLRWEISGGDNWGEVGFGLRQEQYSLLPKRFFLEGYGPFFTEEMFTGVRLDSAQLSRPFGSVWDVVDYPDWFCFYEEIEPYLREQKRAGVGLRLVVSKLVTCLDKLRSGFYIIMPGRGWTGSQYVDWRPYLIRQVKETISDLELLVR